jgi:hypothetical protein
LLSAHRSSFFWGFGCRNSALRVLLKASRPFLNAYLLVVAKVEAQQLNPKQKQ